MTAVNRAAEAALNPQQLRDALSYCPVTGVFKWRKTIGTRALKGDLAGRVENTGYVRIRIYGRDYVAHRLAWAYMMGQWPDDLVDHRDRDRSNNRWLNLRAATYVTNNQNKASKVKFPGAHLDKRSGRWNAAIAVAGNQIHLGTFDTQVEASAAYAEASKKYHGEYGVAV